MNHFHPKVRERLMDSVGDRCSAPWCRIQTSSYDMSHGQKNDGGHAAHIKGAKPGSARHDGAQSNQERHSFENGLWLCPTCHTRIDKDAALYPVELLDFWKNEAISRHISNQNQWEAQGVSIDLREELRRAQEFFREMTPAISALHQMFFNRSAWNATTAIPAEVVYEIYRLAGRGISWRWDNRNPAWCFSPSFRDKIEEILRISSYVASLLPSAGYGSPTINLTTHVNSHGETHYSDRTASSLKLLLEQWGHSNDLLSGYHGSI